MPTYDASTYHPPAPVAHVVVRSPETGETVRDVPMLIDTGADVSVLPYASVVSLLDAQPSESKIELQGFDGMTTVARTAVLEVQFLGRSFRGPFVIIDSADGILGRNVLNAVSLLMDGPSLAWREHR